MEVESRSWHLTVAVASRGLSRCGSTHQLGGRVVGLSRCGSTHLPGLHTWLPLAVAAPRRRLVRVPQAQMVVPEGYSLHALLGSLKTWIWKRFQDAKTST